MAQRIQTNSPIIIISKIISESPQVDKNANFASVSCSGLEQNVASVERHGSHLYSCEVCRNATSN